MRYTSLKLKNFTVFKDASFEFIPGVNVFVGANGTGKTHLLKVLYAIQDSWHRHPALLPFSFPPTFMSTWDDLISLAAGPAQTLWITADSDQGQCQITFTRGTAVGSEPFDKALPPGPRPVFIPSVDMLAHTRRFISTYDEYKIDFDQTYRDIVSLLLSPEKRNIEDLGIDLKGLTGGLALDIQEQDERFYVETPAGRFAAPMVAEGIRKFATVVQLIKNGWIRPGTTLFWDEPEVSVNPSLMRELAKMILTLASAGVQMFFATHSYVLLKELDLQANQGDVRYFALELLGNEVAVHPADSYDAIEPNKIAEAYDSIYDRQLTQATGRWRKNGDGR